MYSGTWRELILKEFIEKYWNSVYMVYKGKLINMLEIRHVMVRNTEGAIIGLLCYYQERNCFHVVSMNAVEPNKGIGSALIEQLYMLAVKEGISHLQVETTNDNVVAIGFYQKMGFDIIAIRLNEVENQRLLKPEILLIGYHNIPIRHIIQFRKNVGI